MTQISFIESDLNSLDNLGAIVRQSGNFYCQSTFGSVDSALSGVRDNPPAILLIDIDVEAQRSVDSIAELKAAHPALVILVVTNSDDNPKVLDALRNGASGCLLKHGSPADILSALDHALHGGSPLPVAIARRMLPLFNRSPLPARTILPLSSKEDKIMVMLSRGLHYKEIAVELMLSPSTVRAHLHTIYSKLNVQSRAQAVSRYLQGVQGGAIG